MDLETLLPILYEAKHQINRNLENLSDREVKDMYNQLVFIEIGLYNDYLKHYRDRLALEVDLAES